MTFPDYETSKSIGFLYIINSMTPLSPFGRGLLKELRLYGPSETAELKAELDDLRLAVGLLSKDKRSLEPLYAPLGHMKDIRRSLEKCGDGVSLDRVEFFEVKNFLLRLDELVRACRTVFGDTPPHCARFRDSTPALSLLDFSGDKSPGFYIPSHASERLADIRARKKFLEKEAYLLGEKMDEEMKLKRARVCIEEESEENRVMEALSRSLAPYAPLLLESAASAGGLDVLIQKALFALQRNAAIPEISPDGGLNIEEMTNPEIVDMLAEKGLGFTPVSLCLKSGCTVITGANMGGKSVALKTLALNAALFQAGFPVCAASASFPVFENILLLSGDGQSIQSGLSGFGSEISRFNEYLTLAEEGFSLFLIDELARSTNPDEGADIVRAVVKYLNGKSGISAAATHFDNVAPYASAHYRVIGLRDADEREISALISSGMEGGEVIARFMNYGLFRADRLADCPRDAVNICRMLSMKKEILDLM